ncbi:HlyD family secretion protein [Mesorhizobium loti]|uniref:Membrane fusion protein (MFP) family protein n=1 Tax=Rhizobium loti TaxID=381 RepID=A0A8E2W9Q9_RHILI|nr:HlyD family type I secretion periplasmic adaptor subunit [Mesorhizobium loti]PWJ87662.1 HlyD family secretion protein [Mesorhizobium loti]
MVRPWGKTSQSIKRHLIAGFSAIVLLLGGVGGWASTTEFSGAVIAVGVLVVDSSIKKVQHPAGGVIGEIRVRDGDRVEAGDIVIRLDGTQARGNLAIINNQLDELAARRARLEAELAGQKEIVIPADLRVRVSEPEVEAFLSGELKLFETRTNGDKGMKAQLFEQELQMQQQIQGLKERASASKKQINYLEKQLESKHKLFDQKLTTVQEMVPLEREKARLEGETASIITDIARTRGAIAETELKISQVDHEARTQAARELAEVRSKVAELLEARIAAEDQLRRIDIRAPQAGYVHELAVHTVDGVAAPGETLMQIVPDADDLVVEVRLLPQDIDQIHVGQEAHLRFSAFNQRTTPELRGVVSRISADLIAEPRTGQGYYIARISLADGESGNLEQKLIPGMPVEAFIQTGDRTVLSYLTKPLVDQIERAFRDE